MHSENLTDQDRCVRLFLLQMPETGSGNLLHAQAHREVIRRFGRFPHRNAALGRQTTEAEAAFLKAGGYGAIVRQMDEAAAAGTLDGRAGAVMNGMMVWALMPVAGIAILVNDPSLRAADGSGIVSSPAVAVGYFIALIGAVGLVVT